MNYKEKFIIVGNHKEIPLSELEWSYVRSSGPGGQNVNRTNSCVVLRWNFLNSKLYLTQQLSLEAIEKLQGMTTNEGDLIIKSQTFRDQDRNYQECIDKLTRIIKQVLFKPKKRVPTKPTYSSKQKRLKSKSFQSDKKASRTKKFLSD